MVSPLSFLCCGKSFLQIKVHKNKSFRPPFSKGGGFQRQSLGRSPQTAKSLILTRDQEGEGNTYQGVPPKKFDFVQSDNSGVLFRQTERTMVSPLSFLCCGKSFSQI